MNIVTIIVDTLRYDHIAINGNPRVYTPNFDRLAEKSWNFHRAFAASFPTIPHRTDVITGRYGAPFHPWKCLDSSAPTIPRVLAKHGYCSQLIHDTPHLVNGGHNFDYPFDAWMPIRGAEVDRAWITDSWKPFNNWYRDPLLGRYQMDMEEVMQRHHAITCYVHTNAGREKEEDWNVAKLFLTASRFLMDNASRDNFFLWLDCFDPHEPWDSPPEFMKMYDRTPGYDGRIDPRAFHFRNDPDLPKIIRERIKAMYKAKVTFVDKWLGVFLDTLEDTGLDQNTAILLTADHGTNVGDRNGHFGKANPPWENESHVPFMLYVPGIDGGQSNIIVQPQDIFSTIMAIVGEEKSVPDGVESFNVLNQAQSNKSGRRKLALAGSSVGSWSRAGADNVIFSAFDRDWRLGFSANPEKCVLQKLGSHDDVAQDNPDIVEKLYTAAIEEIEHRGLDPALVEWLQSEGKDDFPAHFRTTDAKPAPAGWQAGYWTNLYDAIGIKS